MGCPEGFNLDIGCQYMCDIICLQILFKKAGNENEI